MAIAEKMNQAAAPGGHEERRMPEWLERLIERPRRWRQFLHDVRLEMRQVTWPSRRDVTVTTAVVIVTVAAFGVYFFFVDAGVQWLMKHLWSYFKH
jgi:preprotein translocase subunit SecE